MCLQNVMDKNELELNEKEKELENLLEDDEIYWKQHASEDWLNWGDRNTKWFHLKASSRRTRNKIQGLFDENGVWKVEDQDMELASQYFLNLFQSSNPKRDAIEKTL